MSSSKSLSLTKDEALLLVQLVEGNKIVTSKATNATNNQLKDKAWSKIADEFNSAISSGPREPKQLRLKWENLKKSARKRSSNIRMSQYKTGGGKPEYFPPDETLDLVASILGATCEGYSVPFGGDSKEELVVDPNVSCINSTVSGGCSGSGEGSECVIINGAVGDGTGEVLVMDAMTTTPNRKFLFGSSKRTVKSRRVTDELVKSNIMRNTSVAKYYDKKREILDQDYKEQQLRLQKLELENEKLKLELDNLKKCLSE